MDEADSDPYERTQICVLWLRSSRGKFDLSALSSQVCTDERRVRKKIKVNFLVLPSFT